jgi:hypothetical protein
MTIDDLNPDRDTELGDALRVALDRPATESAFAARVMTARRTSRPLVRDALATWSRWGVVAAAVVLLASVLAIQSTGDADASVDSALIGSNEDALTLLMTDETSPGSEILFSGSEDTP